MKMNVSLCVLFFSPLLSLQLRVGHDALLLSGPLKVFVPPNYTVAHLRAVV